MLVMYSLEQIKDVLRTEEDLYLEQLSDASDAISSYIMSNADVKEIDGTLTLLYGSTFIMHLPRLLKQ